MSRLPSDPDTPLLHTRTYIVRAFYEQPATMRLRGAVLDEKPPRLYFPEDDEPLPIHQMVVDLILDLPSLEILDVNVVMEVTPHLHCTTIETTYEQLIGLSIARGFTRKLTELFGGASGCTHIGTLLRAMSPVAIQAMWSVRQVAAGEVALPSDGDDEASRRAAMVFNLNSCHVWAEDTPLAQSALRGESIGVPVWAEKRLEELGRSTDDWDSW